MKKTTKLFCLLLIATLVCGCKQENWLDWKLQNELWLINNAQQSGVKTTPTGLQYKCIYPGIEPGTGTRPDDAKIVVRGTIYEGSMVEISGAVWRAKTVSRVTLKKDGARVAVIN